MTIDFVCEGCGRRLSVPDQFSGQKASCPACGAVAIVPVQAELVAPPADPGRQPTSVEPSPTLAEPLWLLRTPEGKSYGPVARDEIENWVRQGRVTADCDLRPDTDPIWQQADRVFPALAQWKGPGPSAGLAPAGRTGTQRSNGRPESGQSAPAIGARAGDDPGDLTPDRGILILTLGLVGLIVQCPIFSVMAWVMGTADVQEMRSGRMDPRGLKSTQWGRILGMAISLVWLGLAVVGTAWCLYIAAS